jgi:hypothetical protein
MSFSSPIFNRSLTRATLQNEGSHTSWYKNDKTCLFVRSCFSISMRVIRLKKAKGVWTAKFEEISYAE